MKAKISAVLLVWGLALSSQAAIDAYPFPNEELQIRYDALIAELRCPQCLNTNLAGSDAMIAQDLRREVHRMLLEGKSDDEILTLGEHIRHQANATGSLLASPFEFIVEIGIFQLGQTNF